MIEAEYHLYSLVLIEIYIAKPVAAIPAQAAATNNHKPNEMAKKINTTSAITNSIVKFFASEIFTIDILARLTAKLSGQAKGAWVLRSLQNPRRF